MKFDTWFRVDNGYPKVYGYNKGDIYNPMKLGWDGCKEEALKILSKHCNSHNPLFDKSLCDAMREIEKL